MSNLNKNQKIIIIIITSIIIVSICYYIYEKDKNFLDLQNQELEIEQSQTNTTENNITEEDSTINNIVVHISGAVNQEGIVELKKNSRIADAIEKAGGLKEGACMDEINLAYVLEDGMKIHIPTEEEMENQGEMEEKEYITKSSESNIEDNSKSNSNLIQNPNSKTLTKSTKININTATQTELETLPGIGPSTAVKIINYREQQGEFKTVEDIKNVSGIGDNKFNNIKDLICV